MNIISRYRQKHPVGFRAVVLAGSLVVLPIVLGYLFLDLAHWDLSVPLVYQNPGHDEIWQLVLTKMLTDTGWVLTSPFMGAPDMAHWHYHSAAQTSALHSVLMLALSPLFSDAVELQQFYYLINFSLISLASYWCARRMSIDRFTACCIGLLFSFTTFRFNAPFFAFLVNYFAIPLAMVAVFDVMRGTFVPLADPAMGTAGKRLRNIFCSTPFLVGLFGMIVVGTADGYYAFFTVLLLGFATAARVVAGDYRRALSLVPGLAYIATILVVALSLLIPLNVYKSAHHDEFFPGGKADPTLIKHPFEAEVYSSSLKLLLSPPTNHRFKPFADLGEFMLESSNAAKSHPQGQMISIGLLGGVLLVVALLLLGSPLRMAGWGRRLLGRGEETNDDLQQIPVIWAALPLVLFGLLCSTTGGIGSLVALVYPTIRAYDRFPLFLLFTLYIGAGAVFSAWLLNRSSKIRRLGFLCLALVVTIAIFDQVPRDAVRTDPKLMARYLAERSFVRKLEATLPPGSMVYQYPYSQYLQDNKYYGWGAFSHLRMYLHSQNLRWSNGASKNSAVDNWHLRQSRLPVEQLMSNMNDAGFGAIVFDGAVLPPEEYKRVLALAERYAGSKSIEDPVSKLAWIRLPDRGYRVLYNDTYRTVTKLQITDASLVRKGPLPDRLNAATLVPLLDQHANEKTFVLPATGVVEEEAVLSRGNGETKILPPTDLKISLACPQPSKGEFFNTSDTVSLKLTNSGLFDIAMGQGQFPVRVGIHIEDLTGTPIQWDDGTRISSQNLIARKSTENINFQLEKLGLKNVSPLISEFFVVFGVVQDGHAWFHNSTCRIKMKRH